MEHKFPMEQSKWENKTIFTDRKFSICYFVFPFNALTFIVMANNPKLSSRLTMGYPPSM